MPDISELEGLGPDDLNELENDPTILELDAGGENIDGLGDKVTDDTVPSAITEALRGLGGDSPRDTQDDVPVYTDDGPEMDGAEGADGYDESQEYDLDPVVWDMVEQAGVPFELMDDLLENDPERAEQLLDGIVGNFDSSTQQFMNNGPAPQFAPQATQPPYQSAPTGSSKIVQSLSDERLAELRETYGEELIKEVLEPLRDEVIAPLRAMQQNVEGLEQQALLDSVNSTFNTFSNSGWGEWYGGVNGVITPEQVNNRKYVGGLADQIASGAYSQGIELSPQEALTRAHRQATFDIQQQRVREELIGKVQKRANSITPKPGGRRASGPKPDKSDDAALKAVTAKAEEVFGPDFT